MKMVFMAYLLVNRKRANLKRLNRAIGQFSQMHLKMRPGSLLLKLD